MGVLMAFIPTLGMKGPLEALGIVNLNIQCKPLKLFYDEETFVFDVPILYEFVRLRMIWKNSLKLLSFDFLFSFILIICFPKICHGIDEQSQETNSLLRGKASILSTNLAEAKNAHDGKRRDTQRGFFHISPSQVSSSSLLPGMSESLKKTLVTIYPTMMSIANLNTTSSSSSSSLSSLSLPVPLNKTTTITKPTLELSSYLQPSFPFPQSSPTRKLSSNILLVASTLPSPPASQSKFPLSTTVQTETFGTLALQRLRSAPEISQAPTLSPAASYPASKLSSPISATPTHKLYIFVQAPKESSELLLSLVTAPRTYPKCPRHLSCKGRCLRRDFSPDDVHDCNCDPECETLEDCCADFDLYCNSTKYTVSKDTRRLWKCQVRANLQDFWMIQACPKSWPDNDIAQKCINNSDTTLTIGNYADVIPVTSNTNMDIYRNRFCAQCNGVKKKDIRPYGIDFSCSLVPPQGFTKTETLKFLFKYCSQIKWKPNVGQSARPCFDTSFILDTCPYPPLEKKCTEYPPRIVARNVRADYKNIYCAMCHLGNLDGVSCGPFIPPSRNVHETSSFAVIMDISGQNPGDSSKKVKVNCKKDEVYDVYLEVCRSVASKLPSTPVSSHFDRYHIAVWVTLSSPSKKNITTFNSSVIVNIFSQTFGLKETQIQFKEWQEVPKLFDVDILFLDVQTSSKDNPSRRRKRDLSTNIDITAIIHFTRPLKLRWQKELFTIIKATAKRLTCINIKHYSAQQYLVLPNSNDIYINETSQILNEKEYYANQTEKQNGTIIPTGDISVCTQQVLDCVNGSYITLQRNEFTMLSNQSVYRNVSDSIYNQGEYYETSNESVVVCSHFRKFGDLEEIKIPHVQNIALQTLTRVGLSLSVICLAATLVTYTLFAELRTLPGINLMNLSSALLAAHLLWLIGSGLVAYHRACVAMAVILHFAFLSSFMWMSIIAFSTWKAFSAKGLPAAVSNDKEYKEKRIRRGIAVGWLPVLVFVAICISLDQSQAVSIQYGGSKGCWINNGTANLCVFVIPVVMAMLWNGVFFGLTVRSIHKVRQQARMVTEQRENQNSFSVYIKIAVLMGFTWIFGVLGSLVSAYLMYPFVVLCTLQGVYIGFAFTFTRRVLTLYKAKFGHSSGGQFTSGANSRGIKTKDTRV